MLVRRVQERQRSELGWCAELCDIHWMLGIFRQSRAQLMMPTSTMSDSSAILLLPSYAPPLGRLDVVGLQRASAMLAGICKGPAGQPSEHMHLMHAPFWWSAHTGQSSSVSQPLLPRQIHQAAVHRNPRPVRTLGNHLRRRCHCTNGQLSTWPRRSGSASKLPDGNVLVEVWLQRCYMSSSGRRHLLHWHRSVSLGQKLYTQRADQGQRGASILQVPAVLLATEGDAPLARELQANAGPGLCPGISNQQRQKVVPGLCPRNSYRPRLHFQLLRTC
mmetsp:Transcript_92096/g.173581  ORF Transcript_92096/g.173581 Transcript_92096/m.173581 type:complete len:275 (+) Transcript_92096:574-1398(+)